MTERPTESIDRVDLPTRFQAGFPETFPVLPPRRRTAGSTEPLHLRGTDFSVARDLAGLDGYTSVTSPRVVLAILDALDEECALQMNENGISSPRHTPIQSPQEGQPVFLLGDHAPKDPKALERRAQAFGNWMAGAFKAKGDLRMIFEEWVGGIRDHVSIQEAVFDKSEFTQAGFRAPEEEMMSLLNRQYFPIELIKGFKPRETYGDVSFADHVRAELEIVMSDHLVRAHVECAGKRRDTEPFEGSEPTPPFNTYGFSCSPREDGTYSIRVFGASPYL